MQIREMVRLPDGKELFYVTIVDVFLTARFSNVPVTMHDMHL